MCGKSKNYRIAIKEARRQDSGNNAAHGGGKATGDVGAYYVGETEGFQETARNNPQLPWRAAEETFGMDLRSTRR